MNLNLQLLHSASELVTDDMRALVHPDRAPAANELVELIPPGAHQHFHAPLGFVSLLAAGGLLVAAAGVQERVQDRHSTSARRPSGHRKHLHAKPEAGLASR